MKRIHGLTGGSLRKEGKRQRQEKDISSQALSGGKESWGSTETGLTREEMQNREELKPLTTWEEGRVSFPTNTTKKSEKGKRPGDPIAGKKGFGGREGRHKM